MKYNDNGTYRDLYIKSFDTVPIGTEVDFNGTNIPDGWEQIDDPSTYSTSEKKIGAWSNGKPLYRQLIYTSCPTTSANGTYVGSDITIGTNKELALIEWGYFKDNNSRIPINYTSNAGYMMKAFMFDANTIRLNNNNTTWNGDDIVLSILFTKTTD